MKPYKKYSFLAVFIMAIVALTFTFIGDRTVKAISPNISVNNIVLEDMQGHSYNLSSLKGKRVYLKLWASWCPVCTHGLPDLNQLAGEKDKDFEIITVVSPKLYQEKSIPEFKEWFAQQGYKNITVLFDKKGQLLKLAYVKGYPTNLIIDENSQVTKIVEGTLSNQQVRDFFPPKKKDGMMITH